MKAQNKYTDSDRLQMIRELIEFDINNKPDIPELLMNGFVGYASMDEDKIKGLYSVSIGFEVLKEGDKSRGICPNCEKVVKTIFRLGELKFKGVSIKDVLQAYCTECGDSVSIPHQSTQKIKEARGAINKDSND